MPELHPISKYQVYFLNHYFCNTFLSKHLIQKWGWADWRESLESWRFRWQMASRGPDNLSKSLGSNRVPDRQWMHISATVLWQLTSTPRRIWDWLWHLILCRIDRRLRGYVRTLDLLKQHLQHTVCLGYFVVWMECCLVTTCDSLYVRARIWNDKN